MCKITIAEAQTRLSELIRSLSPGDEVVLMENDVPVARIVPTGVRQGSPRRPGSLRGTVQYVAPDFDAPLDDFREYME